MTLVLSKAWSVFCQWLSLSAHITHSVLSGYGHGVLQQVLMLCHITLLSQDLHWAARERSWVLLLLMQGLVRGVGQAPLLPLDSAPKGTTSSMINLPAFSDWLLCCLPGGRDGSEWGESHSLLWQSAVGMGRRRKWHRCALPSTPPATAHTVQRNSYQGEREIIVISIKFHF